MSTAAYYFCERLCPARTASATEAYDYVARRGKHATHPDPLVHLCCGWMPGWVQDRVGGSDYWAAADQYARTGARRYFKIIAALPKVLDPHQRIICATEFADAVSRLSDDDYGRMPYTLAIHSGHGRNPHLELLLSPCLNKGLVLSREKWFRRHWTDQPARGGARKVVVISQQRWLEALRETWENVGNRVLARYRTGYYLDRRSYAAQGSDRIPGLRLGPMPCSTAPNPAQSRREQRNREIEDQNRRREEEDALLSRELKRMARQALRAMDGGLRKLWFRCVRRNRDERSSATLASVVVTLRKAWRRGKGNGVGAVTSGAEPKNREHWQRLQELVQEPAYQYAAAHWLDGEWVAGIAGPYVVWLHPEAAPLIDSGGAIWTSGNGPVEAAAVASLLHSRGVLAADCSGSNAWRRLVARTFARVDIKVAATPPLRRPASRVAHPSRRRTGYGDEAGGRGHVFTVRKRRRLLALPRREPMSGCGRNNRAGCATTSGFKSMVGKHRASRKTHCSWIAPRISRTGGTKLPPSGSSKGGRAGPYVAPRRYATDRGPTA